MTSVTVEIPADLERSLAPLHDRLPQILALGIRELNADGSLGFEGAADVLEFLAGLPTPDEILRLRPSPELQVRIDDLLDKSREQGLSAEEEHQWQQYCYLEHLVRKAKINATRRRVES